MGLILITPKPNKTYWIMSDPQFSSKFIPPLKTVFKKAEYVVEDDVVFEEKYNYVSTYFFDNGIKIPTYHTGLKIGYKFLKGYFLANSSADLMAILHRIAYPIKHDVPIQKSFNYEEFRLILEKLKNDHPELMI